MKPITFPEQNIVIAKDQPQYLPLPAHKFNDDYGTIVFCISVSKWEAIKLLFTGKLWVQFLTFHGRVTPSFFSATKSDVIIIARPENKFKMALYNATKWCRLQIKNEETFVLVFAVVIVTMITVIYFLNT